MPGQIDPNYEKEATHSLVPTVTFPVTLCVLQTEGILPHGCAKSGRDNLKYK